MVRPLPADGSAMIGKPGVEFLKTLEPGPGSEQPFPDALHLALNLPLFPTGTRLRPRALPESDCTTTQIAG